MLWDIQKCIYNQLNNDNTINNLVDGKIYDEPPTNIDYPYILLGDCIMIDDNDLSHAGYSVNMSIQIHTIGRGYFIGKQIFTYIDNVLHLKKLTLDSGEMLISKLDQMFTLKYDDKRVITARYNILVDTNINITF